MSIEISKYDDCCYRVSFRIGCKTGEVEISHGIWCPISKILSVDGAAAGIYETKEDIIKELLPDWEVVRTMGII